MMTHQSKLFVIVAALTSLAACAGDEVPAASASSETAEGTTGDESSTTGSEEEGEDTSEEGTGGPGCGNGVIDDEYGEQCDDANNDNSDDCLNNCTNATCGDGFIHEDVEDCDDGNIDNLDGCTNECKPPACGDLIVHEGEECDDGNDKDYDTCTTICTTATCGDGFTQLDVEECDDGNDDDNDLCTSMCTYATCGDGVLQGDEACDDGNNSYSDGCLPGCIVAECGDGWVYEGFEDCDDNDDDNNDECLNSCAAATCGDGIIHTGVEQCDDGNSNNNDACTNACGLPDCGNGVVEGSEQCDDNNSNNTDACLNSCINASCGDGFVRAGQEACDDANDDNTDGCLTTCALPLSCKNIKDEVPNASSGVYEIDPDGPGGSSPRDVYCEMSTDGGGWTLVASSRNDPPRDQASDYYSDLTTVLPGASHTGVWDGMRPLAEGASDIRFTCSYHPNFALYTVDLSFYDIGWYDEITTGSDADSCFSQGNGYGDDQPEPARRNNRNGQYRGVNNSWNYGYLEGEDYCGDQYDFGVDFDDRGMDSYNDGTDWGLDDGVRRCRYYGLGSGAWHIWVREN